MPDPDKLNEDFEYTGLRKNGHHEGETRGHATVGYMADLRGSTSIATKLLRFGDDSALVELFKVRDARMSGFLCEGSVSGLRRAAS